MELDDLWSNLNALKKLYGLLQSAGNILQVAGSENLDDASRQLLKKLLDGATEEAFKSHSKIQTEKSLASFLPDSSQQLPTSNTKPSMEIEIPESSQAPEERDDESQSHQRSSAAELKTEITKEQGICRICEHRDVKPQTSAKEKILSYSNEKAQLMKKKKLVHRQGHSQFKPQDHLSKSELGKDLDSREEAQVPVAEILKNPSMVGLRSDSTNSLVLHIGSENGPLELCNKQEKKCKTASISKAAVMPIRRIDANLALKKEKELLIDHQHVNKKMPNQTNELKSQPVETSGPGAKRTDLPSQQKRCRTDKMDPPPPPNNTPNQSSLIGESTSQMNGKALEHERSSCTMADAKYKAQLIIPKNSAYQPDNVTKRKISASSSSKVPTNLNRHRVPDAQHKKGRDSTGRMMGRIADGGPSRLGRVQSTRTVDHDRVRSRQLHNQDPAKQPRNVGPILEECPARILSSSGPVKAHKHQQKKRMRHQLTWRETPRRANRRSQTNSSCTSCCSASRTSASSWTPSPRIALANAGLTQRALDAEMRLPRRTLTQHAGPTTRKLPLPLPLPMPPPIRDQKSLTKPKMREKVESSHRKVGPLQNNAGPTTPAKVEEKREGRLRRLKNKLGIIFHHHHHHHHHHHLGGHEGGVNGGDDDRSESSVMGHHQHRRSFWRYLRDMMHHTSKAEHVKLAAEAGGDRATGIVEKSVVRRVPRNQQQGHLHVLVERLLRHLWHSKKQQKRLGKKGSRKIHSNNNKKVKRHWWPRLHKRKGVKLVNHKNTNLALSFRRPKDKKTV